MHWAVVDTALKGSRQTLKDISALVTKLYSIIVVYEEWTIREIYVSFIYYVEISNLQVEPYASYSNYLYVHVFPAWFRPY